MINGTVFYMEKKTFRKDKMVWEKVRESASHYEQFARGWLAATNYLKSLDGLEYRLIRDNGKEKKVVE